MKVIFEIDNVDELSMAVDCLKHHIDTPSLDVGIDRNIVEVYKPLTQDVLFGCRIKIADDITVTKERTKSDE